mmetsp:Transcript_54275/g.151487  ORF Transcript_54275/g.151487 Transcript_54275/m.151487 type:complete len:235 (+) Transcript_54275:2205-2909(+)
MNLGNTMRQKSEWAKWRASKMPNNMRWGMGSCSAPVPMKPSRNCSMSTAKFRPPPLPRTPMYGISRRFFTSTVGWLSMRRPWNFPTIRLPSTRSRISSITAAGPVTSAKMSMPWCVCAICTRDTSWFGSRSSLPSSWRRALAKAWDLYSQSSSRGENTNSRLCLVEYATRTTSRVMHQLVSFVFCSATRPMPLEASPPPPAASLLTSSSSAGEGLSRMSTSSLSRSTSSPTISP